MEITLLPGFRHQSNLARNEILGHNNHSTMQFKISQLFFRRWYIVIHFNIYCYAEGKYTCHSVCAG
jgi:hypothetical protein